ncbi:MAG TPA: hypothetical protein VGJ20_09745 [Xanthobacteraceae bacterium]|jgi:hypothetical protein
MICIGGETNPKLVPEIYKPLQGDGGHPRSVGQLIFHGEATMNAARYVPFVVAC